MSLATVARPTLMSMLSELLTEPPLDDRFGRGSGGPERTDILRRVAIPALKAVWPPEHGRLPRPEDMVSRAQESRVRLLLPLLLPLLDEAIWVATQVLDRASLEVTRRNGDATRSSLSERACTRAYRMSTHRRVTAGELAGISDEALTEAASEIADLAVIQPRKLSRDEFVAQFASSYQQCWEARGEVAVLQWSPRSIGLGHERQPRLVSWSGDARWWHGTNRAVYVRYSDHFDPRAASRSRPRSRPQPHPTGTAVEEIDRVCSGYGLTRPAHRIILASLAAATDDQRPVAAGSARWFTRPGPVVCDATSGHDEQLWAAARDIIARWYHDGQAQQLRAQLCHGAGADLEVLTRVVVRKVWMGLHGLEREVDRPATRREVRALLQTALDKVMVDGYTHFRDDPDDRALEAARGSRAWDLLLTFPELVLAAPGSPAVLERYRRAAQARYGTGWVDIALSLDELRDEIRNQLDPATDGRLVETTLDPEADQL